MTDPALVRRFAENLRAERARAKLSQEALAHRADVHRTQISLMEAPDNGRLPRLDTLVKLAGALEVQVSVLLEGISFEPVVVAQGGFAIHSRDQAAERDSA